MSRSAPKPSMPTQGHVSMRAYRRLRRLTVLNTLIILVLALPYARQFARHLLGEYRGWLDQQRQFEARRGILDAALAYRPAETFPVYEEDPAVVSAIMATQGYAHPAHLPARGDRPVCASLPAPYTALLPLLDKAPALNALLYMGPMTSPAGHKRLVIVGLELGKSALGRSGSPPFPAISRLVLRGYVIAPDPAQPKQTLGPPAELFTCYDDSFFPGSGAYASDPTVFWGVRLRLLPGRLDPAHAGHVVVAYQANLHPYDAPVPQNEIDIWLKDDDTLALEPQNAKVYPSPYHHRTWDPRTAGR